MNETPDPHTLRQIGEHFAAGCFEDPDASPMRKWSRAVRRRLEARGLPIYQGTRLYPSGANSAGPGNEIVKPSYSYTYVYDDEALCRRMAGCDDRTRRALIALQAQMRALGEQMDLISFANGVGGRGYTHSIPNYGRVLREGLDAYAQRIDRGLERARRQNDERKSDFYSGLLDVLLGLRNWHGRMLRKLREMPALDGLGEQRRQALISAYQQVPFRPARTLFEAMVAYNWVFYADDCDNPGRVDLELWPYYEAEAAQGHARVEATGLIRELWENTDANNGWSAGIGGTGSKGEPAYTELTAVCLEAARSIRRPNLQLHIRRDMPQPIWDAAMDTLATGCGLPALYNEEMFLDALRDAHLGVRERDLGWYNGGGCTETMIHGCSNVGSLDAGINLPLILTGTLERHLAAAPSFQELEIAFLRDASATIKETVDQVNASQEARARWRPQPMRSLLVDDCIDDGVEFNAGGARYNWSTINVAGLANVVDSLVAIRQVVYDQRELSGREMLELLQRDFRGAEDVRKRLAACPKYGNDDPCADELARDVSEFVFREFMAYTPWRGGKFLASCLMFTTYARAGEPVGATPDGRQAGEPIADSAGPHQGRDRSGPTAMLKSVAGIPHHLAPGTLVVNARFSVDLFRSAAGRQRIQDLVRTYFDLGGMQIQVNVVDQKVLLDAMAHPDRHEDLIVRIGGYSEYFNRLSSQLQASVLERTEHAL